MCGKFQRHNWILSSVDTDTYEKRTLKFLEPGRIQLAPKITRPASGRRQEDKEGVVRLVPDIQMIPLAKNNSWAARKIRRSRGIIWISGTNL